VVADLKGFNASSNLLTGLSMTFLQQVLQHHLLILQKVRCKLALLCLTVQVTVDRHLDKK
jgi:hypothetical protein